MLPYIRFWAQWHLVVALKLCWNPEAKKKLSRNWAEPHARRVSAPTLQQNAVWVSFWNLKWLIWTFKDYSNFILFHTVHSNKTLLQLHQVGLKCFRNTLSLSSNIFGFFHSHSKTLTPELKMILPLKKKAILKTFFFFFLGKMTMCINNVLSITDL